MKVEGFKFQVEGFRFQVSGGEGGWILRLDADEYLTEELGEEIKQKLPGMPEDVDGVVLKRRHVVGWLGDVWVKRGMYPARILRLFRRGKVSGEESTGERAARPLVSLVGRH